MGLFDVSPREWINRVMNFSQASLDNTLDTVKEVHQTLVEIPINVAEEFGLPPDASDELKSKHRRVLDAVYTGVRDACGEVNDYVVQQTRIVDELVSSEAKGLEGKLLKLAAPPPDKQDKKLG